LIVGCPSGEIVITDTAVTFMAMSMPGMDWDTIDAYEFSIPTAPQDYCTVQSNEIISL